MELIPDMKAALGALTGIDMLSPLGTLLVNQQHETEDPRDKNDVLDVSNQDPGEDDLMLPSIPYTHEGDLEDVIADELPCNKSTSEIHIQGKKTTKAKALQHQMADHASQPSTDHLKCVQQLPCFDVANRMAKTDIITSSDSPLGAPSLHVGSPVALLVRCEGLMVSAITQVNQIQFALRDLDSLPAHLLADPMARVDSQILCLIPATLNDGPTQVHDWCWSLNMEVSCNNVPGQDIHPINPSVSVQKPGSPTFLFKSTFLVTLSCILFQELRPQDQKNIPMVKQTEDFPYQYSGTLSSSFQLFFTWQKLTLNLTLPSGKACFMCKASNDKAADLDGHADCSRCGLTVKLDRKSTPHILEHIGAHILHDMTLNSTEE